MEEQELGGMLMPKFLNKISKNYKNLSLVSKWYKQCKLLIPFQKPKL